MSPVYTTLLSIVLCMFCLAGTTWAWFTANQKVDVAPITAASWNIKKVNVSPLEQSLSKMRIATDGNCDSDQNVVLENGNSIIFDVEANVLYSVKASAKGNTSHGFLLVETCDGNFYMEKPVGNSNKEAEFYFEMRLSESGPVTISASWGSDYERVNAVEIPDDCVIGEGKEPECICEILCVNEKVRTRCLICLNDYEACEGEMPECICEDKCGEEADKTDCLLCVYDKTSCKGEMLECSCIEKCEQDADGSDIECKICIADPQNCLGPEAEPLEPVCNCDTKCKELSEFCEICKEDIEKCIGEKESSSDADIEIASDSNADKEES